MAQLSEHAVCAQDFAFTYANELAGAGRGGSELAGGRALGNKRLEDSRTAEDGAVGGRTAEGEPHDSRSADEGEATSHASAVPTIGPLDWKVGVGAFHLLVGPTGSGKTTLLRSVSSILAPAGQREGTLEVFGERADELDAMSCAQLIGYVAQNPENQIVCDTVWHELAFSLENLGFDQDTMRRRVAEVAHFFGIEPWFHREIATLSDGQKQMVALASAMALRPRLLLLDEPTAQLDPVAEKNFLHELFRINRELGVTVVVATHAPSSMADYAGEASELVDGRLHAVSPADFAAGFLPDDTLRAIPHRALGAQKDPIEVEGVYVRYRREDDWVLRGCDFRAHAGLASALVGGNGCGKTTLLRTIAGVLSPERGYVRNDLMRRQAFLPQNPCDLFACDTVVEELREWQAGCGYDDIAVIDAIRRFGLEDVAGHHPYDLSAGQQQELAFAKLLLTDPDLLLADEPTRGLDAASQMVVADAIAQVCDAGVTVIVATHDLTFAALACDEIAMLFDGEVTCAEQPDAFFTGNLFYRPLDNEFAQLFEISGRTASRSGE